MWESRDQSELMLALVGVGRELHTNINRFFDNLDTRSQARILRGEI
jgi:hypothetical protein